MLEVTPFLQHVDAVVSAAAWRCLRCVWAQSSAIFGDDATNDCFFCLKFEVGLLGGCKKGSLAFNGQVCPVIRLSAFETHFWLLFHSAGELDVATMWSDHANMIQVAPCTVSHIS